VQKDSESLVVTALMQMGAMETGKRSAVVKEPQVAIHCATKEPVVLAPLVVPALATLAVQRTRTAALGMRTCSP
jgi:hypothetical protein